MIIKELDTEKQVLIVAEIGNNHEGNFNTAKELIRQAAACAVDAVKFQTFKTEYYVSAEDPDRFRRLKSFELEIEQFAELAALARELGLIFISTPFDLESACALQDMVDAYKISSGDNNFNPLLARAAETGKPLIVSTGLSSESEVRETHRFVTSEWQRLGIRGELALLHCVSAYPVKPAQANLRAIEFLKREFDCTIGYSDHTIGIEAVLAATALGAKIIEKHFTLDKHFSSFRDHQLSADPEEMKELVEKVRLVSQLLGDSQKSVQPDEEPALSAMRRRVAASRSLRAGERLSDQDITWLRSTRGLLAGEEQKLIGKCLIRPLEFGEPILISDVECE